MKRVKLYLIITLCACCAIASAQNKISMPSKQYLLQGVQNKMFVQTFMKNDNLAGDIVRFEGTTKYAKSGGVLAKSATIDNPIDGKTIEFKLYDGQTFEVKESKSSVICSGDPTYDNGTVTIQFLGDSFTRGCYFKDAFLTKGYVPNAKLVGTRTIPDTQGQCHEGRGGWTVEKYFSNNVDGDNLHNPFLHPSGNMKYWGAVEFWKIAHEINKTGGKELSAPVRYNYSGCDTSRFNEDGFLISPKKGDLMYNDGFIAWNGKRWEKVEAPRDWSFDYGKYLEMWELDSPQFLVVMLGLNDFRNESLPLDFATWNQRIEKMLASYKAAVPNGRLLLSTPCTSCGVLDNDKGHFTTRQNAMMWHVRENIITTFDNREQEGIYVVDASITIDNENGYNKKQGLQTGNPHPYPNYPALGVPLAACVQNYRAE